MTSEQKTIDLEGLPKLARVGLVSIRNFKCVKWVITLGMNTLTAMLSSSQQHLKTCLKDKKTVNFAKHNIHGLAYHPRYQERAYEHDEVDIVLLRLYNQYKTEERTVVVAFKGGHVEKDFLNKLNIPCLGLP